MTLEHKFPDSLDLLSFSHSSLLFTWEWYVYVQRRSSLSNNVEQHHVFVPGVLKSSLEKQTNKIIKALTALMDLTELFMQD